MRHMRDAIEGGVALAQRTKVCPRCGATLFADMDVCYGCMYDFSRDPARRDVLVLDAPLDEPDWLLAAGEGQLGAAAPEPEPMRMAGDPSKTGDLGRAAKAVATGAGLPAAAAPAPAPVKPDSPLSPVDDDTWEADVLEIPWLLDNTKVQDEMPRIPNQPAPRSLLLCTSDVDVLVPLPNDGLIVGRSPSCDVVLHALEVSRMHMRIIPQGRGALVEDLGSKNPIMSRDGKVVGSASIEVGESVFVGGAKFTLVAPSPE